MTNKTNLPHALYVVRFQDDRIKIGITSDVGRRMLSHKREARRNRLPGLIWWSSAPFKDKTTALTAERIMCRVYADFAISEQREWFAGDADDFAAAIGQAERLRAAMADESEPIADLPFMGSCGYWLAKEAA